jgi:plasmid stabilization system protein ParE
MLEIGFPKRGRSGRAVGTREPVIASLPYLVVYAVELADVLIYGVAHGAQDISSWAKFNRRDGS